MKKVIIISLILGLVSCMTAEKHLQKFYSKGGKLEPVERIVTVYDTIKGANGKDSIIEKLVQIPCPEPKAPKTKWEVRFDNKRFDDSLKHVRRIYKDSLDHQLKALKERNDLISDSLEQARKIIQAQEKTDRKENNKAWLFWIGFTIGCLLMLAIVLLGLRAKKYM